jgi:hypothetical protein
MLLTPKGLFRSQKNSGITNGQTFGGRKKGSAGGGSQSDSGINATRSQIQPGRGLYLEDPGVYLQPRWTSDRDGHASAASIKFELALTYPIIAISRSSKSWRRSKRRNDGKLNWRSCGRHTSSVCRIASPSCHLKYCLSPIRWYCTSNVYFRATHRINPIYYEVPACDCRCIRPRPRQDATIVWIAVVGYRQCRRHGIGRQ